MQDHTFDDDPSHPIPKVGVIDTVVESDQALRYGLVIAAPLDSSERSLKRLQRKCDGYIEDFRSPATVAKLSKLTPGKRYIYIFLNAGSSAEARAVLADCKTRAESVGIAFSLRED
jgi:hypothetical protein